jgi:hypothetical protein
MRNEEEAGFMGILYEVLITSTWMRQWPQLDTSGMKSIAENPMYLHCRNKIQERFQRIVRAFQRPFVAEQCFETLYTYTEFHILLSQKITVHIHADRKEAMASAWASLIGEIRRLTPMEHPQKAQVNLCRSLITGIADMMIESEPIVLYEIKTCSGSDWKEDAFTQAALYMCMTQNRRGHIRLLNPFRRELCEYHMSASHQIQRRIGREVLLWNLNCFLAKHDSISSRLHPPLRSASLVCMCEDQFLEWLAPTRTRIGLSGETECYTRQDRQLIRFHHTEPILQPYSPPTAIEQLGTWLHNKIGYILPQDYKTVIDWEDPFAKCVLLALFIRLFYHLE